MDYEKERTERAERIRKAERKSIIKAIGKKASSLSESGFPFSLTMTLS